MEEKTNYQVSDFKLIVKLGPKARRFVAEDADEKYVVVQDGKILARFQFKQDAKRYFASLD